MADKDGFTMISFHEARERVLAQVAPLPASRDEEVPIEEALGRILAAPAVAGENVPNHDNSAMDGYAIHTGSLNGDAPTPLTVVADLPAGSRLTDPVPSGGAVRIMTGAPIPPGCDGVVMQEDVTRDGSTVVIPPGQKPGQHIRPAGEDIPRGQTVFQPGRRLGPAELGVLTALGYARVPVKGRLKVALLSTGNEVVTPGTPLEPGQVYDSNRATLRAALTRLGVEVLDLGLARDDRDAIAGALQRGATEADAILTTGGVSVGDFDLVKEVITRLGHIDFWKVAMKPGKPQAYGRLGNAAFFGLPGNPVSTLAVFLVMVRPALLKMMGAEAEPVKRFFVPVKGSIGKKHDRLEFQRGILRFDEHGARVESTGAQGSGILSSFAKGNCLVVLPEGPVRIQEGELAEVWIHEFT